MEHLVVTGFVDGKRARGRQRETFTNKPPMELLLLEKDRVVWSKCVQNNNQRLYEDKILIDDELYILYVIMMGFIIFLQIGYLCVAVYPFSWFNCTSACQSNDT